MSQKLRFCGISEGGRVWVVCKPINIIDRLNMQIKGTSAIFVPFVVYSSTKNTLNLRYKIMKNFILILVCVAAVLFLVGSIGALECNHITTQRCLIQSAIAIIVEWIALKNIDM